MNPNETQELTELIRWVRDKFQIAILLIEHDMRLVMQVCERIYVVDYGTQIAHGVPSEIQNNPKVIEAYQEQLMKKERRHESFKLKDLHVNYGAISALHGLNIEVNAGEIVTILGSNGAGKTTTLHTISGLLSASKGEVIFKGEAIHKTAS